ncbi:MAG: type II toxin-antitoxin system prevent-host-death family antitoxin [Alphaproteobacteria bacterium]|nr:type II toxin-antitoxin system prevent-host-death family antitoxin [Alphaproteobacteria bacterium]
MKTRLRNKPFRPRRRWLLQDAKTRFSEVFERAIAEGPQRITRHGKEAVVVVAAPVFDDMCRSRQQPQSLIEFFQCPPSRGLALTSRGTRTLAKVVRDA